MEAISYDVLCSVFLQLQLSTSDWTVIRSVCPRWRVCADRIDVVKAVYERARGYSAERLTADDYKRLILERRAFEQIMFPKFESVRAQPFTVPEKLKGAIEGLGKGGSGFSLAHAGFPDHFATRHGVSGSARFLVWNTLTLELERSFDCAGLVSGLASFQTATSEPRLACVTVSDNTHRLELWDPTSGERVSQSDAWESAYAEATVRSVVHVKGSFALTPYLAVYSPSGVNAAGPSILKIFDADTLAFVRDFNFNPGFRRVFNHDGRVAIVGEGNSTLLNIGSGEEGLWAESVGAFLFPVDVGDRKYILKRTVLGMFSVLGMPGERKVDCHFTVCGWKGARWCGKDFVLVEVNGLDKHVRVWSSEGEPGYSNVQQIESALPHKPYWQGVADGRSYNLSSFVPIGRGLVWTGDNGPLPIALLPKKISSASTVDGRVAWLVLGALALVSVGMLVRRRWLKSS